MNSIPVKLDAFEGPLDLLLHLIEKNKVDIYDIPIAMITDQYIEYIKAMQDDHMDVMTDFLVMAATLLRIKDSSHSIEATSRWFVGSSRSTRSGSSESARARSTRRRNPPERVLKGAHT